MDNLQYALDGAWRVLLASLLFGAVLPVIFAVGVWSFAWGSGGEAEVSHGRPHPVGKLLAGVCFLVVLLGVVLGIAIIAATGFGKEISFDHGYPTVVTKEG
ncbi:hypothetical protein E0H73_42870 [Kribbella pittospori]|uniref:Uncharacterized protein n=1 Tax=Kribbella pittospori TaxID=722689 RepID=A0A4R0K188_9ACTN|nr:hypothetical protein E0H73_42870 [Kribbella pittospori]